MTLTTKMLLDTQFTAVSKEALGKNTKQTARRVMLNPMPCYKKQR